MLSIINNSYHANLLVMLIGHLPVTADSSKTDKKNTSQTTIQLSKSQHDHTFRFIEIQENKQNTIK